MKENNKIQKESVLCKGMAKIAFAVAHAAANSRCVYIFHQPDKPKSLMKLKKF
jgi:cyclic lactone autoinducer peptide